MTDIKIEDVCIHARSVFVEYRGATLLDLEHIECEENGQTVRKKRSDCYACYRGEVGLEEEQCLLFDLFRMLHPIDLEQRKPDENKETVVAG